MADKAGGILARLGTPADTDVSTDIANVKTVVDAITGGVGVVGGAMLSAERFSQIPVFEDWTGIVDKNQISAPGIDDLTLMQSRHPWAAAWITKESDGASTSTINTGNTNIPSVELAITQVGGSIVLGCLRQYRIGFTGNANMGPSDERIIFESILSPVVEDNDAEYTAFFGFVEDTGPGDVPGNPWNPGQAERRFGFAMREDSNIYGVSGDGTAGEVTADHDLVNLTTVRYLKCIYDVGTNIKFYVDDTLIGTLTTRLPVSTAKVFSFIYWFTNAGPADGTYTLRNYMTRIRWQNGATP